MNKGRINELLSHPAFISLLLWVLIVLIIPPIFTKFRIRHLADELCKPNTYFHYSDLDGDNNSELISVDLNDNLQTKIIVKKENKVVDQYDLIHQPYSNPFVYTGDSDNDGFLECYVFTMNQDSIFLNIFEPVKSRKMVIANRFIDFRGKAQNSIEHPKIVPLGMAKGLCEKNNDLFFYINSGYGLQPRNVYRYMIGEDSLVKSPESGEAITACSIFDLNEDDSPEFLINGLATGNLDKDFPYSDRYSWGMVLNKNLNFCFPPLKLTANPSRAIITPLKIDDHFSLVIFNEYFGSGNFKSSFSLVNLNGEIVKEEIAGSFEDNIAFVFPNDYNNYKTFYFLRNKGEIIEMDRSFKIQRETKIPDIGTPIDIPDIDLDLDGRKEHIFESVDNKRFIVFQHDFKDPVTFDSGRVLEKDYAFTSVLESGAEPEFYVQYSDFGSYYRYERNILFYLKYPFYLLLYLSVLLFISLIFRIQKYRLNLKLNTERKIAELQMRSIKNQMDPHFTLNILNAIGSLYATEDNRDKADYIFGKYAKLIRQTVISSDKIIVTLADEIDFIRNIIDLEKFRKNNSFSADVEIRYDVDLQLKIPRMLIYTFVENAIKYGISKRNEGGYMKISIGKEKDKVRIVVEDNGPGLQESGNGSMGTGKGLSILNELIDLYFRLEKTRITYSLQNLAETNDVNCGTRAIIEILSKSSG